MRSNVFSLKFHLISYSLLLVLGTIVFRATDLDLLISDFFYFREGHWISIDHPFWGFVYKYFTGPNIFVLFLAVVTFIYTSLISKNQTVKWSAFCVVIAIVIGPGILVNGTLKPMMGRPRPYEMERYNSSEKFVPVLSPSNKGKSFPSGHAASGFALTILFYVFYRHRKKLAWFCWFSGMGFGILLSLTRIVQGGHFVSDNFWAMGITQLVNCVVYFLLQPKIIQHEKEATTRSYAEAPSANKLLTILSSALVTILFVVGYLINFPFTFYKTGHQSIPPEINQIIIKADLEQEKIKLFERSDSSVGFDHLVFANGFPWSESKPVTTVSIKGDTMIYSLRIEKKGTFRDYRGRIKLILPKKLKVDLSQLRGEIVEDQRNQ